MKFAREFLANVLVGGLLIVLPIYLAVLVLLKGMQSAAALLRPLTVLLPAWLPAAGLLSLALVLVVCFLIGVAVRTRVGRILRERVERSLFERLPGYALFRSLTQRLAGEGRESAWKPALVEIEEALVPAFIIEELEDGRFTVFRPVSPHALRRSRLHPQSRTRACARRAVHTGDQLHLLLGIGLEGPGGSDDEGGAVSVVGHRDLHAGPGIPDFSARRRQFRRAEFTFAGGPCTYFGLSPRWSKSEAKVCRRSCGVKCGKPARRTIRVIARSTFCLVSGVPASERNTHGAVQAWRSARSFRSTRCRRKTLRSAGRQVDVADGRHVLRHRLGPAIGNARSTRRVLRVKSRSPSWRAKASPMRTCPSPKSRPPSKWLICWS